MVIVKGETAIFHIGTVLALIFADLRSGKGLYLSPEGRQGVDRLIHFMSSKTFPDASHFEKQGPGIKGKMEGNCVFFLLDQFSVLKRDEVARQMMDLVNSFRGDTANPPRWREKAFQQEIFKRLVREYGQDVEVIRMKAFDTEFLVEGSSAQNLLDAPILEGGL